MVDKKKWLIFFYIREFIKIVVIFFIVVIFVYFLVLERGRDIFDLKVIYVLLG